MPHEAMADLTNHPEELLDVVNRNDEVTGQIVRQDLYKDKTLMHRSVRVLIYDKQRRILFQKRSLKKKIMPGLWTLSAAGHVPAGSDPLTAARKELKEELGFSVPLNFLVKELDSHEGREFFAYIYTGQYSGQPINPDPNEVEQVRFMNPSEIENLSSTGQVFFKSAIKNAKDFWKRQVK